MHTILIRIPLIAEQKAKWDETIRSPIGVELTRRQKGFVSAEFGYSTEPDGTLHWNMWEKWETREDFANYNAIPERLDGSDFINAVESVMASPPVLLWLEDVTDYLPAGAE